MSIAQALNTSLSGLRATQAGLWLVASNVANAQTPGYIRKSLQLTTSTAGDGANSVHVAGINRELDQYLQRQFRVESAGGSYADLRSTFYQRLQQIYGAPGSDSALETLFSNFTNAVQALVTSPDSTAAQSQVLNNGQVLAQSLNGMTAQIQAMRSDAENGLADAVATANAAMEQIAQLNTQLAGRDAGTTSDAALMDQRDSYIDQLAQLMDIRVVTNGNNKVSIFTNSGVQLVGDDVAHLEFNPQGTVMPQTQWSADPAERMLGTLSLVAGTGTIDLIANRAIRSGKIAAYLEMRDDVLVQAQHQLDGLAAAMSQALSEETVTSNPVTSGLQTGFDVDTAGMLDGNTINITYTDNLANVQRHVTIMRVDDASALPLDDTATANPNDEVIGLDFSGGLASVAAQLNTLFSPRLQFSVSGTMLTVLDDGAGNLADVDALTVTRTPTSLAGGAASLPFFTDGGNPYTGAISTGGSQMTGFAGRVALHTALLADPSRLIRYASGTSSGDPTRPNFIYNQLIGASLTFSAQTGLGNAATPFSGSLPTYLQQVLSMQGAAAANAQNLAEGQDVVVNALEQRVAEASGVNIDQEMAHLITLQTAYSANARVMTAVRDMIELLLRM